MDLRLAGLAKHLREQETHLEVTVAAKAKLAVEGVDRIFGARPLRKVITTRIADRDTVVADVSPGGGFTFQANPRRKDTVSETPDLRRPRWLRLDISS